MERTCIIVTLARSNIYEMGKLLRTVLRTVPCLCNCGQFCSRIRKYFKDWQFQWVEHRMGQYPVLCLLVLASMGKEPCTWFLVQGRGTDQGIMCENNLHTLCCCRTTMLSRCHFIHFLLEKGLWLHFCMHLCVCVF